MPTQEQTDLWAIIQDQQEQIDELKGILNRWKFNGAEDMLGGGGYQRFGGNIMRLDGSGVQMIAPTSAGGGKIIWFFDQFYTSPEDSPPSTLGYLLGRVDPDLPVTEIDLHASAGGIPDAELRLSAGPLISRAILETQHTGEVARLTARARENRHELQAESPLWLDTGTSDPPAFEDGYIWYRSDLNEFRVRVGGATHTINTTAV